MFAHCPLCIGVFSRLNRRLHALRPLSLLAARLLLARIFFVSGLLKISDWGNTIQLFTTEYPVPFLPPLLAAISGTAFELICPVLLVLGLAARLAALPLLAMTAVINFTYLDAVEHYCWAALLFILLTHGAGVWSLDARIARKCGKGQEHAAA